MRHGGIRDARTEHAVSMARSMSRPQATRPRHHTREGRCGQTDVPRQARRAENQTAGRKWNTTPGLPTSGV
ncbi:hypothetical protein NDU88_007540 [Pleurodeles waltl]|uniref:Uncharacterized protein n=1 Tax=Pleurodeles waltl TaxID=8319 RepID=A0AAV7RQE3_PLEWA|nr:hypothetical protein NDU88_007540 [Pleurodeles waltl]